MKPLALKAPIALLALALLTAAPAFAQEPPKEGGPGGPGAGGPGGRRPPPPLMAALDTNKDGEIDATEIANAAAALKTLDKNGDGKLSGDEIHPARGDRGSGGPDGPGGRKGRGPKDGAPK